MALDLVKHIKEGKRILFLGEGNFSFSFSVVKKLSSTSTINYSMKNLWITCYESDSTKVQLNDNNVKACQLKNENKQYLESVGCHVLEGVDAENLTSESRISGLTFSKIIFMFPHVGGKMKINRNRKLLLNVISSCRRLLTDDGDIVITLCRGQGGTPAETVIRSRADTWRIVDTCHEADCILTHVETFCPDQFSDYTSVGYRGLYKGFNVDGAMVHVIKKGVPRMFKCISGVEDDSVTILNACSTSFDHMSLYPPVHVHHLSFWLPDTMDQLTDDQVGLVLDRTGVRSVMVSWRVLEHHTDLVTGRHSQTLELVFSDTTCPLGHTRALHLLINIVGRTLENCYHVIRR